MCVADFQSRSGLYGSLAFDIGVEYNSMIECVNSNMSEMIIVVSSID